MTNAHVDRVAVVTGGSGAIGQGIVRRLLAEGARVHTLDARPCPNTAESRLTRHLADVRVEQDMVAAFEEVRAREGRLDYLVACAGIFRMRPFLELSLEEWRDTLAVNLRGAFLASREAVRLMQENGSGRIVLISSMVARTGGPGSGHYAASKAGILGLARSLALEVAERGIRVNTLSPGITDTPMPRGNFTEEVMQQRGAAAPLGRIGRVDDMVEACMFLLDDENSYMTGQDLRVAGGSSLW